MRNVNILLLLAININAYNQYVGGGNSNILYFGEGMIARDIISQANYTQNENEDTTGLSSGVYVNDTFLYSSTIDNITDLYGHCMYDTGVHNAPLVFLGHHWGGDAHDFTYNQMKAWVDSGNFVAVVGMRGRNSASGTRDDSGRELHDIYDAIQDIRDSFPTRVSNKVALVGFSGGGGNAMGLGSKFPDAWVELTSLSGMSKYGIYGSEVDSGWYETNGVQIYCGTPATCPDNYEARDSRLAMPYNFKGGFFTMHHATSDALVAVSLARYMDTAYTDSGNERYFYDENEKYGHASIADQLPVIDSIIDITPTWTIPRYGSIKILGYLVTNDFEIWLNDGTDAIADLTYNLNKDVFEVDPLGETIGLTIIYNGETFEKTISDLEIIFIE